MAIDTRTIAELQMNRYPAGRHCPGIRDFSASAAVLLLARIQPMKNPCGGVIVARVAAVHRRHLSRRGTMVADEPPSIQLLLNSAEQPYLQAGQLGPPSLRFARRPTMPQWWLAGAQRSRGSPMPKRRTNDDAMINEFSKAWAELDRAAVAEVEAWSDLEQELERELERALGAARRQPHEATK